MKNTEIYQCDICELEFDFEDLEDPGSGVVYCEECLQDAKEEADDIANRSSPTNNCPTAPLG